MELAEFAAVVAGADGGDACARGGVERGAGGDGNVRFVDAVDHDFVGALSAIDEFGRHAAAEDGA